MCAQCSGALSGIRLAEQAPGQIGEISPTKEIHTALLMKSPNMWRRNPVIQGHKGGQWDLFVFLDSDIQILSGRGREGEGGGGGHRIGASQSGLWAVTPWSPDEWPEIGTHSWTTSTSSRWWKRWKPRGLLVVPNPWNRWQRNVIPGNGWPHIISTKNSFSPKLSSSSFNIL